MSNNMGLLDRRVRGFLVTPAAVIVALVAGFGSILGIVLLAVAAVTALTATVGFCPLYALFHLDTRGRRPLPH
jgi:hypothetical protein